MTNETSILIRKAEWEYINTIAIAHSETRLFYGSGISIKILLHHASTHTRMDKSIFFVHLCIIAKKTIWYSLKRNEGNFTVKMAADLLVLDAIKEKMNYHKNLLKCSLFIGKATMMVLIFISIRRSGGRKITINREQHFIIQ